MAPEWGGHERYHPTARPGKGTHTDDWNTPILFSSNSVSTLCLLDGSNKSNHSWLNLIPQWVVSFYSCYPVPMYLQLSDEKIGPLENQHFNSTYLRRSRHNAHEQVTANKAATRCKMREMVWDQNTCKSFQWTIRMEWPPLTPAI